MDKQTKTVAQTLDRHRTWSGSLVILGWIIMPLILFFELGFWPMLWAFLSWWIGFYACHHSDRAGKVKDPDFINAALLHVATRKGGVAYGRIEFDPETLAFRASRIGREIEEKILKDVLGPRQSDKGEEMLQ